MGRTFEVFCSVMKNKDQNIFIQWKEPFRYKRWKDKEHWAQYPKWRFYASYVCIFVLGSFLFTIGMYLLDSFIIHENLVFLNIFYKSLFFSGLLCFLLIAVGYDTTKVVLHESGISYYQGGEWTAHTYSDITGYEIKDVSKYTKPLEAITVQLISGESKIFGISSKINTKMIAEILNANIKKTEQGH